MSLFHIPHCSLSYDKDQAIQSNATAGEADAYNNGFHDALSLLSALYQSGSEEAVKDILEDSYWVSYQDLLARKRQKYHSEFMK